jgi:hypothetical protein
MRGPRTPLDESAKRHATSLSPYEFAPAAPGIAIGATHARHGHLQTFSLMPPVVLFVRLESQRSEISLSIDQRFDSISSMRLSPLGGSHCLAKDRSTRRSRMPTGS